jgi:surfactin synthase thioesterase subunit
MTSADDWIRCFEPAPYGPVQLICFPHAGGSASFFFPVGRELAPAVEVLAVQYPGRQDRRMEPGIDDIAELADRIVPALDERLDRPFAFFGHSMGATVAYEVARRIGPERGREPKLLFASGRRAPSRTRDRREEEVHLRDDDGIVAELQRLSGTNARLLGDPELLRMIMPAVRSDYRAIETYAHRAGPELSCPVTALVGDADPLTTLDEAEDWAKHTTGAFDLRTFPGGHFYLAERQSAVLRVISERLRAAR